jgi:CheY-like chemotaxis protein
MKRKINKMIEEKKSAIILLAEDDPGDQKLTRKAFKDGKIDNTLYIVENGEEALDYLLRRGKYKDPASSPRPDLFLLDLNMPKIDGRQVLEEIKNNPDCPNVPTVVLTTSKQEEDIIRTYDLGVKSYITKPVDFGSFVDAVQTLGKYWFQLVVLPPVKD